jgi:hypothetical protein
MPRLLVQSFVSTWHGDRALDLNSVIAQRAKLPTAASTASGSPTGDAAAGSTRHGN